MTKAILALMSTTVLIMASPARAADSVPPPNVGGDFSQQMLGLLPPNVSSAITITRDGDNTKVTLDFQQLAQPMAGTGFKIIASPMTFVFTPLPDGTFHQTTETTYDFALNYQIPVVPHQSGSFSYQGIKLDGIFDPKLEFYRALTATVAKGTGDVQQADTGMTASVTLGENVLTLSGAAAGDSAINIRGTQTASGLTEHVHIDPSVAETPQQGPVMDFDLKLPQLKADYAIDGLKSLAARDLFVFLMNNRNSSDIAGKQVEFKQRIRDLVPIMNSMSFTGEARDVSIQTAFGQGGASALGLTMALDTRSPSSSLSFGERFDDIKVDSVFIPAWSKPMIPTAIDLEFNVNGFDVAGMMSKFVDALDKHDFSDPKPDTTDYEALGREGIAPNGGVHIDLKPSSITAAAYKISWQGGIDTHGELAKAHIDVTATGTDEVIKSLSLVRDKGAPEAVIGLYAAKALAKPGPNGTLLWAIDIDSATGGMLVNGVQMGPKKKT